MGLSEEDPELLCLCGMLHDVGKAKVPEDILNNPGRLTHIEYEIMTAHTLSGKQVLDELGEVTRLIKETAVYHHERVAKDWGMLIAVENDNWQFLEIALTNFNLRAAEAKWPGIQIAAVQKCLLKPLNAYSIPLTPELYKQHHKI